MCALCVSIRRARFATDTRYDGAASNLPGIDIKQLSPAQIHSHRCVFVYYSSYESYRSRTSRNGCIHRPATASKCWFGFVRLTAKWRRQYQHLGGLVCAVRLSGITECRSEGKWMCLVCVCMCVCCKSVRGSCTRFECHEKPGHRCLRCVCLFFRRKVGQL